MKFNDIEKKEYDRYFSYYDFSKNFTNKTFLITGAKGILGQAIIKWLLYYNKIYHTNIKIYASTRNESNIPEYIENDDNIKYIKYGREVDLLSNKTIDYIIHLVSPTDRSDFTDKSYETILTIIESTKNVIEVCKNQKKNNHDCKILYMSSEEVYGSINSLQSIDEKTVGSIDSLNPRSCYPLAKKCSELMLITSSKEFAISARILRASVIFGLFQKYEWDRIETEILRCVIESKNLVMRTKGLTKKSNIYTLDCVTAVFIVLIKGKDGEVYNVTNTSAYDTVSNMALKIFKKFNSNCKIDYRIDNDASKAYLSKKELLMNVDKLKNLSWLPKTSFDEIYKIDIERFKQVYE